MAECVWQQENVPGDTKPAQCYSLTGLVFYSLVYN